MQLSELPDALRCFVDQVTPLLDSTTAENALLPLVKDNMRYLVEKDNWLDPAFAEPDPKHYQQYLLYADPQDRFSVISFVWGPGQQTPVHDHLVWGVIGMLRGSEIAQSYELGGADGTVLIAKKDELELKPGDVACVSPTVGDIHQVRNALSDQISISIHAYGGNIGKIKRHVFSCEGGAPKEFVSGYSIVPRKPS